MTKLIRSSLQIHLSVSDVKGWGGRGAVSVNIRLFFSVLSPLIKQYQDASSCSDATNSWRITVAEKNFLQLPERFEGWGGLKKGKGKRS